jgi:parallel beta-helix repeat protein
MILMKRKLAGISVLLLFSACFLLAGYSLVGLQASGLSSVHNLDSGLSYATIQAAINAPQTMSGDLIAVDAGTYYEHVVVNKSISLVGASRNNTIVDAGGTGNAITVNTANVTIEGFTVRNGVDGIYVEHADNFVALKNNASFNVGGVYVRYSHGCLIHRNIAGNNTDKGIFITNSSNFTASSNRVYGTGPGYGLNANASTNGLIALNEVFENYFDGIGLGMNSRNCVVSANDVHDNVRCGLWLDDMAENNTFYHNNIINNAFKQVIAFLPNRWDNGLEGNYWSNYTRPDVNKDGVGETPHTISANNTDNYPLKGRFSEFMTFTGKRVNVVSNSTIAGLQYHQSSTIGTITMHVSNAFPTQRFGFCRVQIPNTLIVGPYTVMVDGAIPMYLNASLHDDGDSRWIYFTYNNSTREVTIQGISNDVTPPAISVSSPSTRTYLTGIVRLNFTVSETPSWMGYSLDVHANVTVTGNTTLNDLSEGAHSIVVYANDTTGNMGCSSIVRFAVDTQPPHIVILSPQNTTYNASSIHLTFTIDETLSWMGYSLDDSAVTTVSGNTTISNVFDGLHSITLHAADLVSHTGVSAKVYFTVDTRMPEPAADSFSQWIIVAAVAIVAVVVIVSVYYVKVRRKVRKT